MSRPQVIALLLPEVDQSPSAPAPQATMLVRDPDGQMFLEKVRADVRLERFAMAVSCFRRGKPIVDPVSRQVMGYEMEMVATPAVPMR